MINKFLARTKSKLYSVRRLCFYLANLMYNLWVALKHSQGSVIADSLKLYAMMTLVMSFINLEDLTHLSCISEKYNVIITTVHNIYPYDDTFC